MKKLYTIKYFNGKSWEYLPSIYLNSKDNKEEKNKTINELEKNYPETKGCVFNISNFFNIYI